MSNWKNRIVGHGTKPADQFLANPENWRTHPPNQREAVRGSLNELGWIDTVIENVRTGNLIDGHERVWQALQNNNEEVPYIQVDLSEEEERLALATLDPITAMANTDREKLGALLHNVKSGEAGVQALLAELAEQEGVVFGGNGGGGEVPDLPQVDRAEELQAKWLVASGDVWEAGKHIIICGDCVEVAATQQQKADLLFIDPPYGVKRDKGFEGFEGFGGIGPPIARRQYMDDWDAERPTRETMDALRATAKNAMIFGGNFLADILPQSTHWIVWDKLNTMPTFGDCELIWTNFNRLSVKKVTFEYNGLIGKEAERFHPTQKPLGLCEMLLKEYSKEGQTIVDYYGGAGTTLVACERLGRLGRGVEIEPKYVAVTLERLQGLGLDPRRLD